MDELIIQVLHGDAPPDVIERVRTWRNESQENESRFRQTERVWSLTEPERASVPAPADLAGILAEAEQRRSDDVGPKLVDADADPRPTHRQSDLPRRRARWSPARWALPLAAAIAAVALGIRVAPWGADSPAIQYQADGGASRVVALGDGSFIKLAPGSALRAADADGERDLALDGRAFFAVAHDPDRPFVVRSHGAAVRVLGTRFEVAATEGGLRIVVVDGLVAVSNAHGSLDVPAGSVALVGEDGPPASEPVDDVLALLDWPSGVLLFQATPLAQVATEVGRRFGQQVEVRGERLQALRISGTFEEERFDEVILALCQTAGAECALTDDGARIGPPEGS